MSNPTTTTAAITPPMRGQLIGGLTGGAGRDGAGGVGGATTKLPLKPSTTTL